MEGRPYAQSLSRIPWLSGVALPTRTGDTGVPDLYVSGEDRSIDALPMTIVQPREHDGERSSPKALDVPAEDDGRGSWRCGAPQTSYPPAASLALW